MTVRAVETPRQPLRIVVDRHAQTPAEARVLEGGALVVTAGPRNPQWLRNVETIALPDADGRVDLRAMMQAFGARSLNEIHVEAGARLNGALLECGVVDEIVAYVAPSMLGEPARGIAQFRVPRALRDRIALAFTSVERIGDDLRIVASVMARS
jgi:diaminohydroxyphosphoribosylaminopyrimidine deaminase/5-amino-6-(5-phosphoribosylamino)uracil reductase